MRQQFPTLKKGAAYEKAEEDAKDKGWNVFYTTCYHSYFSPQSGRALKLSYLVMVVFVITYTLVIVLDGVVDTCAYFKGEKAPSRDVEVKFLNPEFDTRGGCLRRRFWFLLWLTPEECMLCRRILISVVLGMLIGFERRRADRPAGVRTMALVSLGSCIFTIDSMFAFSNSPDSWDSSRVAAAIPSGVGFLGAGLIYKRGPRTDNDRHEVHGLTTASSVWLSAAAGIAAGGGLAVIAFFSTMVMIIVLRFGPRLPMDIPFGHSEQGGEDDDDDHVHPSASAGDLESGTRPLGDGDDAEHKGEIALPPRRAPGASALARKKKISFGNVAEAGDDEEQRPLVKEPSTPSLAAGYSAIDSGSKDSQQRPNVSRMASLRD